MSKLTVELKTKIDDYREAAQDEIRNMSKGESSAAAREALEDAIAEAIARGSLEHALPADCAVELVESYARAIADDRDRKTDESANALMMARWSLLSALASPAEPAKSSVSDYIAGLLLSAKAGEIAGVIDARGKLERYVSALEREIKNERARIADKETSLQAALSINAEQGRALEAMRGERDYHKTTKQKEIQLRVKYQTERDEAWSRIRELESFYADARAEIARLEEALRATDSTEGAPADCAELDNLKTQLADAERARDDYFSKLYALTRGVEYRRAQSLRTWHKTTGAEIAEKLITVSGWLDVVADGYLRDDATPKGARKIAARLREIVGQMCAALDIARAEIAEPTAEAKG